MATPAEHDGTRTHTILSVLAPGSWRKLNWAAARECGPAAETLAGVWAISQRDTYVSQEKISRRAMLPLATCRKHLKTLSSRGWLVNNGKRTDTGRIRRTVKFSLTKKARTEMREGDYGMLPWWGRSAEFNWSEKVLLALWFSRLASLKRAEEVSSDGEPFETVCDAIGAIEGVVGDINDRFYFTLSSVTKMTALSRPSFVRAKKRLKEMGLFTIYTGFKERDLLCPNIHFRVVETPSKKHPGKVTIDFQQNPEG